MTTKTAAEIKAMFENGDIPDGDAFGDLVDSTHPGYKRYCAHIFQEAVFDPYIYEKINEFGASLTLTRSETGTYSGIFSLPVFSGFTTQCFATVYFYENKLQVVNIRTVSSNMVTMLVGDVLTGALCDDWSLDLEIRLYP